jgi:hypothetical protein
VTPSITGPNNRVFNFGAFLKENVATATRTGYDRNKIFGYSFKAPLKELLTGLLQTRQTRMKACIADRGAHFQQLRSALFWYITQRRVVILYRRFGTAYLSHLQGSRSPRIFAFERLDS